MVWLGNSTHCNNFSNYDKSEQQRILWSDLLPTRFYPSLVPRPRPQLLVACSTEKQGEAGLFSYEHDIIDKLQKKKFETKRKVSRIVQPTIRSTLGVHDSRPPLAKYVW